MRLLIVILAITVNWSSGLISPPVVKIPGLGNIEGSHRASFKGRLFYTFEGVPYARPPVGDYRFREPAPLKPWDGIWEARTIYKCMQHYHLTPPENNFVVGSEDCLYLNIYTPNLDQNANLDVVVYIHGGAFMYLYGGLQGPEYILDKNIVYINLNYRLGPLGFLSTEDDVVPGNNGLKDQIFALQWIKDHVKLFGGNPNSVTIFGMSAGGSSIHFHYLSAKSRGLFQRGISQSGTMLNPWVLAEKPLEKAKKLASGLGCPTTDTKQMIHCLKQSSGHQIVASVRDFQPWLYSPFSPFGVVVDSWASDPVLPEHPYILLKNKKVADLPWIASYTSSEGLYPCSDFYFYERYLNDIDTRWNELIPLILDYNYTVDPGLRDDVSQKIRQYYFGDEKVSRDTFMTLVKLVSDRMFIRDIQKGVRMHSAAVSSPVFVYYFSYHGAHSKSETRTGSLKNFGAAHGDDTSYVFKTKLDTTSTENDRQMVELFIEMVASFANTGKPKVPAEWRALSKNVNAPFAYLNIASPTNLTMEVSDLKSVKFWDSLPIQENEKLYPEIKKEFS